MMKTKRYDLALVREYLEYSPDTGVFRWARDVGCRIKKGQIAGSVGSQGYIDITAAGHRFLGHRLAWLIHYGSMPLGMIDHINGNRSDNRIANLRDATSSENSRNAKTLYNNASGVKGVWWNKLIRKWEATIRVHGETITVGRFDLISDAESAIRAARDELHGEFANHGNGKTNQEKSPFHSNGRASLRPVAAERV